MKRALDCRTFQKPNKEELMSRISSKVSEEKEREILITKLHCDCIWTDQPGSRNKKRMNIQSEEPISQNTFLGRFYGLADQPTVF